eukprot:3020967-Alexandrium_andersonii.AAC.1
MRALSATGRLRRCMDRDLAYRDEGLQRATCEGLRRACICTDLDVALHAPSAPCLHQRRPAQDLAGQLERGWIAEQKAPRLYHSCLLMSSCLTARIVCSRDEVA